MNMKKWVEEAVDQGMGWNLESCPAHYVKEFDLTFQWLPSSYHTVQEYNTWRGNPGPDEEVVRTRRTVLMELNHQAILELNQLFKEGDIRALKALYLCQLSDPKGLVTLGYDFYHKCPTVTTYFND